MDVPGGNYNTTADSFLVAEPSTGDKIVQIMQVLMQNGMDSLDVQNAATTFVNRLPAYELVAKCKLNGKRNILYLCVASDGKRVYCMYGFGGNAPDANIVELMRLAHTIKVK